MKRLVVVAALAVLLASCSSPSSPRSISVPTPTQPVAPSNVGTEVISHSVVNLWWTDNSNNEDGFNVYRDGALIDSVRSNANTFQDKNLNYATRYSYSVSAYNGFGESSRTAPISAKTLNPSITITLDRVGVYESGEPWLRGAPEQYLQLVATDGTTTQEHRIPYQGYLSLDKNETIHVGTKIFSTQEAGDYLSLFIIAYEKDNSEFEQLVTQALGAAALGVVTQGAPIGIGGLFAGFLGDFIGSIIGSEDDHLGTYEQVWYADDLWGAGKHEDVARQDLRVWFTISVAGVAPTSSSALVPTSTLTLIPTPTPLPTATLAPVPTPTPTPTSGATPTPTATLVVTMNSAVIHDDHEPFPRGNGEVYFILGIADDQGQTGVWKREPPDDHFSVTDGSTINITSSLSMPFSAGGNQVYIGVWEEDHYNCSRSNLASWMAGSQQNFWSKLMNATSKLSQCGDDLIGEFSGSVPPGSYTEHVGDATISFTVSAM